MTSERKKHLSWWTSFAAIQVVLLPTLVALATWRSSELRTLPSMPVLRNEPLTIRPQYDYPLVITDEQLDLVLRRLQPRLRHERPKINYVDHALRFWGVEAEFDDPQCLFGKEMLNLLVHHHEFKASWGEKARPLLERNEHGVSFRTQQGAETASHVDHTLATLAEVGIPLDHPLVTSEGETNVEAALRSAVSKFALNQQEYEWTALALALYAPSDSPWYSKEGQQITFDLLADRIMRQGYSQGVCYGNHRLYTLTILLRVDDEQPILSPSMRGRISDHLMEATRRLVASQSEEGYWDQNWINATHAPKDEHLKQPLTRRLLATGHALEWWAMAPRELHPPREVLVRAGQWLVVQLEQMDDDTIEDNYTFLTHVGRALAIWRGDFPARLQTRLADRNNAQ